MSVHKKLMDARIRLQSVNMKKSGLNKFAGYDYFELSDFIPHVQKIFNEIGLCGVVSYEREIARLTITDTDNNTEIVITSPMAGASLKGCHDIQNLGAVETYQRRYLWVTALEILEHDALDGSKPRDDQNQKTTPSKTLPEYPETDWSKNAPTWRKLVIEGKKTAQNIIDMVLTKGTLSEAKKELIKSWEKENANANA